MKHKKWAPAFYIALLLLGRAQSVHADTFTVSGADGNGGITGAPGEVVGYDFTFHNSSAYYAVLNFSTVSFTPSFANYTDFLAANYVVVPPNTTTSQAYSYTISATPGDTVMSGAGAFTIDSNASIGEFDNGSLTVDFDLYTVDPNDPNFDPTVDGQSYGNELSASVSVSVTNAPVSTSAPEPTAVSLVASGIVALCVAFVQKTSREKELRTL